MKHVVSELDEKDLGCTATVFSPHPDDETLGCGGTIIKKKRAGAEVKIFYMTDGRKSHFKNTIEMQSSTNIPYGFGITGLG